MKQAIYVLSFVLLIDLCFQNCANPGRPTGGPKDTIPPTLIYSSPTNGTTNFQGSTIELEFDEFINADKLRQQLIITPSTDLIYKSVVKRNKLILKLEGQLEDSTTYNFNFANGVTDITEKNPAINLSIALSTGPFIDSMSISGSIETLLEKEPAKNYVVGLYPYSDTLDLLSSKPMYFTTANDSGDYHLNYIKTGNYKIISFDDDNDNFLLDPEKEAHGFIEGIVQLDSATSLKTMRSLLQNVKPLTFINVRTIGKYVEAKYNKQIENYETQPSAPSNIIGDARDVIRFYKPSFAAFGDTLTSIITSADSLGNQVTDTIKYVFLESNRKPAGFSYSTNENRLRFENNQIIKFLFNKPVSVFDTSKISIQSDTLFLTIPSYNYIWNTNRTQLELQLNTTSAFLDSLEESLTVIDSLSIDSTSQVVQNHIPEISIVSESGAFLSIDNDTSKVKSIPFVKEDDRPEGVLKVQLDTEHQQFEFQLIDRNGKVAYKESNNISFTIPSVKPGEYKIRILIDNNNDGKWSYGNLLKDQEPEEVFLYEEPTSVRANWVVELSISF